MTSYILIMYHILTFAYIGVAPLEKYQYFARNLKRSITKAASTDGYTEMTNLDKATRADLDNFVRENGLPDDASQLEQGKMYCVDDMIEAGADPIFNGTLAMAFINAQCVTWMRQVCFVAFCI